jgi:hypothetical protein
MLDAGLYHDAYEARSGSEIFKQGIDLAAAKYGGAIMATLAVNE